MNNPSNPTMDCSLTLEDATILIVDDQPANNRLLEMILRSSNYTNITTTTDPREAVKLYALNHYDLVLLDFNMPYLTGIDVMKKFQEIEQSTVLPVLMITAQTDKAIRHEALTHGAQDFLTKPFDRLEVIPRIRNILTVRLLNNCLEEKVRERTQELETTRLEIIQRLGRAAEYRDNETGQHVIRVSKYARVIGHAMGADEEACDLLEQAIPMHDVGKIGIPDGILLKPGRLDADEFDIIKTHTEIGREILADYDVEPIKTAQIIAYTHHEKYDGSGYPNNLKGEEIPLAGRICAVADVFDAVSSKRPYKEPWPLERVLNLLKEERGRHFDPKVVDLFIENLPEILEIQKKYQD